MNASFAFICVHLRTNIVMNRHPTAIIETDVSIGDHTSIWDAVHIRHGASLGRDCIVGEKTYLAPGVVVGDLCKLNAQVYVCQGVTIEDGVPVAPLPFLPGRKAN